ncbi:hypothetical protein BLA29_009913, partial [Euroglyphus maynei]
MKPGKTFDNVRLLFEQCMPIFKKYDSTFEWNAENAMAVAGNYRRQTLETLQSLIRIEYNLLLEQKYCHHLKSIVFIQRFIRGRNETRRLRDRFLQLRWAAIVIQRYFRAKIVARKQRSNYERILRATIIIQRWYRCQRNMIECRNYVRRFLDRRQQASITIQRFYRGYHCRIETYRKYPILEIISTNLRKQLNRKQSLITIEMKTNRILKRMEKSSKNPVKSISDQFITDLTDLCRFFDWSLELRYRF